MYIKRAANNVLNGLDKQIVNHPDISDSAFRLYAYIFGLSNGITTSDEKFMKVLRVSKPSLMRYKAELKRFGLLHTSRIAPKTYFLYLGDSKISAKEMEEAWTGE